MMDAAEFLSGRAEEVAAFSALLFRKRPREQSDGGDEAPFPLTARSVVHYRRPSSANVPLSEVTRLARLHLRRSRRFVRLLATEEPLPASPSPTTAVEEGRVQKKKRPLTYKAWCLLLRRRRRLAWRRRATARRRMRRRHIALRQGKVQLPLCKCGSTVAAPAAAPLAGSPPTLFLSKGRTAVLWLPSHWRLCRRFHYGVVKTRVNGCSSFVADDGMFPRLPTIRIAVPMKCQRKQHRVLQRWAARLSSCSAQEKPLRRLECKPMFVPPPLCFAAERSHVCVWTVKPWEAGHSLSAEEVLNLLMLRTNGTPSVALHTRYLALGATSQVDSGPQGAWWRRCEDGVFYGYMWSLTQKTRLLREETDPFDSDATPIVVPAKLLQNGGGDGVTYLLVAAAPVHFGARTKRNLNIQLISHWNPCGASKPMCSMFELWCCADAIRVKGAETPWETDALVLLEWIRRRVNAAVESWRRIKEGSSSAHRGRSGGEASVVTTARREGLLLSISTTKP
ncbi:hypothetical protein TRSC58_00738 [Trypanosoma rangeli SC58]|uniref:Uncharacterized protein n=1 Tax=Trypanosoma rangeli SC58 TaxID=429131 RepID=A0A061JAY1_TRYRA|nr:hypothetical protein TRSC58_00738 [Trypanosoma rangeli SC58]